MRVVVLQNRSEYHSTIVIRRNRFEFHLQLSLKNIYYPMIKVTAKSHHTIIFSRCKSCSWTPCRFTIAQSRQLWVLICLLRQKCSSSVRKIFHDQMTSTTIRTMNESAKVLRIFEFRLFSRHTGLILWI